ncbi:zinc ABC transporter substrate-binding protein [Streptomyces sp. M19]
MLAVTVTGCEGHARPGANANPDAALRVVTTTEILADLVRQVGGDRVQVDSIVPPGGDPHSYEPTPADADAVSRADLTFTNHLLLEEHALIKTIDSNAREGAPNVSLAEASETYGANVIPWSRTSVSTWSGWGCGCAARARNAARPAPPTSRSPRPTSRGRVS